MTTTASTDAYARLTSRMRELGNLRSVSGIISWDQETYMPGAGAASRAEQSALLARLIHDRATSGELGDLIAAASDDASLDDAQRVSVERMREDYERDTKLDASLVSELAMAQSQAQEVWKKARAADDFASFVPALTRVMDLTKRKGEALRTDKHGELYDALLDEYEPGMTAHEIESVFTPLRERLSSFIQDVTENGTAPDVSFTRRSIPVAQQDAFGRVVTAAFGFDFERGRLDTTTHPFCSGVAPGDTRMTTRYDETNFPDAIGSTMHECGHGLYEQGLPKDGDLFGTPLAQSISLGIHESQSRLWENMVGRSEPFWRWALPIAKKHFAPVMDDVELGAMVRAMNTCTPSFIRVESDEATYNLHIMLRFELERALIRGDLAYKDLPGAWNESFKDMLGLDVPSDAQGCLQDVHWSFGLVGYFPTYTLGNLYGAQMWETINDAIPDLNDQMARGEFSALLSWLREHLHQYGRRYSASELIERATGSPLSADPLMRHLESRVRPAYGLA